MLDFIFCCGLFVLGMIAACVDWRNLSKRVFYFSPYVTEVDAYGNRHAVPNTFEPWMFVAIIIGLIILYFVLIYFPAKFLHDHLESKSCFCKLAALLTRLILGKY